LNQFIIHPFHRVKIQLIHNQLYNLPLLSVFLSHTDPAR